MTFFILVLIMIINLVVIWMVRDYGERVQNDLNHIRQMVRDGAEKIDGLQTMSEGIAATQERHIEQGTTIRTELAAGVEKIVDILQPEPEDPPQEAPKRRTRKK